MKDIKISRQCDAYRTIFASWLRNMNLTLNFLSARCTYNPVALSTYIYE